jgi:hypothetical protein
MTDDEYYDEADQLAQQQGEIEAEFIMSWVNGGGRAEDARTAYRMHHTQPITDSFPF